MYLIIIKVFICEKKYNLEIDINDNFNSGKVKQSR